MRVGIVGAGALGTLFGASLGAAADVQMLVRDAAAERWIAERGGLAIEGTGVRPTAVSHDPRSFTAVDVVLVAVKSYATVTALEPLRPILPSKTPIVSLQNGLAAAEQIARALPQTTALALGPTTEAALLLEPGLVRRTGSGATALGWARGREATWPLERLAELLGRSGLAATVVRPIEPHLWAKAVANAAINPLSALAGVPNGILLERPDLAARLFAIAREVSSVAAAAGIALPFSDPAVHVAGVVRATAANRSSMLQDLERGRPTEIEEIDGAVVRAARRLRVAVPETARTLDEVRARARA